MCNKDVALRFRAWIGACRPRTLLLAIGVVSVGSGVARLDGHFSVPVFVLSLLTAISLQILSNLANDWGDFAKGTDTTGGRVGPQRALQSGAISPKGMQYAMFVGVVASLLFGGTLLWIVAKQLTISQLLIGAVAGIMAIVAAITYTTGKHAYGYKGMGDLFVFLFFGIVAVVGTHFLHVRQWSWSPLLPAIGMGCFSVLILHLNNMRDAENDARSHKKTLAVYMGPIGSKIYHITITLIGCTAFGIYSVAHLWHYRLFVILLLLPLVAISIRVWFVAIPKRLDALLTLTALCTALFALGFSLVCMVK